MRPPRIRAGRPRDGIPALHASLPFFGHTLYFSSFGRDTVDVLCEAREALGPLFWINVGMGNWLLTSVEPEGFELLKNRGTTSTHQQETIGVFVGRSVLGQDGAPHHHMRSAMNGPFAPRGMTASGVADLTASIIDEHVGALGDRFAILEVTRRIALDVIFRIMGVPAGELAAWRAQFDRFALAAFALPIEAPLTPVWWAKRARRWLDQRFLTMIAAARGAPPEASFLAQVVQARDAEGATLDEGELLDNLRLLALAGHETTASTMAWMAITLAQRADLWDALREEAAHAPATPRTPQEARAYPFAEALFRETLRLRAPVPILSRRVEAPLTLAGHQVREGTIVGIPVGVLGRHPSLFPDPTRFDPGRWLGRASTPTPLETAAFGGGPHFCLGYHLAWTELVQFAIAFARELERRGAQPKLVGKAPRQWYMPFGHPTASTTIELLPRA